jgi:hypothetical protein
MIAFILGDPNAAEDGLDAGVGEDLVDEGGELPVPVPDQVARLAACLYDSVA